MRSRPLRLPRIPAVLGGWPRRAAAGLCFALALVTSLGSASSRPPAATYLSAPAGTVAASAAVYADAVTFLRAGDRIDLVETGQAADALAAGDPRPQPVVVARGVRVLAVRASSEVGAGQRTAQLLVAAPAEVAVSIAAHQGDRVLAAIGLPP